ncbi:MAG: FAD-dependent oxidoreductase [Thermodesulfobacteriota bacterium]
MKAITIVGAGISGLTAAIILAREGHEVTVLEQKKSIGGASLHASSVSGREVSFADMTPLDLPALGRYLGFPLEPATFCNPLPNLRLRTFGKVMDMPLPAEVHMKMVERGSRDSSLDNFLYRLAKDSGVRFSFGAPLRTRKDFSGLPPGSIVATGMFRHAFEALDIPHTPAFGYFAGGSAPEGRSPFCVAYYDDHTHDYAYYASANGVGAAVLFQRGKPLSVASMSWFPRQLEADEGLSFSDWNTIEAIAATPTGAFSNPRLFCGDLILTGTLAGMQDPSMVLGVHGALVSGRIAAMAVSDRDRAAREFRRMNRWWKSAYAVRRLLWATHPWGPRRAVPAVLGLMSRVDPRFLWLLNPAVPGWMRLPQ